ncbi:hypothetical protein MRB53_037634 [Persea americana]|nr:hypothetical protein MRB53_037634 [Persea americana]
MVVKWTIRRANHRHSLNVPSHRPSNSSAGSSHSPGRRTHLRIPSSSSITNVYSFPDFAQARVEDLGTGGFADEAMLARKLSFDEGDEDFVCG